MENIPVYAKCAILAAIVVVLWLLLLRRKRRKENQRNMEDKLREEALDRILIGGRKGPAGSSPASVPFDVKYDLDQRKKEGKVSRENVLKTSIMLQLTERSELSTRKYMFHVTDSITFGSRTTRNEIVITGPRVAEYQCAILRVGKELYAKNIGTEGLIVLKRKRKRIQVDKEAVALHSGDTLVIGDYSYEISILNNK